MKLLLALASLFAAAQAQFSIGAPAAGTTLTPGSDVTVQIIVPIDTVSCFVIMILRHRCPNDFIYRRSPRVRKQGKWKSAS